jgi:hypothetical protein
MDGVLGTGGNADAVEVTLVGVDNGFAVDQPDRVQRANLDAFTRPAAELEVDQKLSHGDILSAA